MPTDRRHVRVPAYLGVQVRMYVDKARSDHLPVGIDHLPRITVDLAQRNNHPLPDRHITHVRLTACAIHDGSTPNNDIVHHPSLPSVSLNILQYRIILPSWQIAGDAHVGRYGQVTVTVVRV